jgi:hypothetical protein
MCKPHALIGAASMSLDTGPVGRRAALIRKAWSVTGGEVAAVGWETGPSRTHARTDGVRWTVTYRDAAHGRTAVAVAQQGVAGAGPRRRILWRPGCVSNKHVRWSMLFNQATATDTDSLDHAARLQANQVSAIRMINTKYLPKQKSEWREQGARKTFVSTAFLCGCVFALRRD